MANQRRTRCLAIIPARGGSTRVPSKNKILLGDKTLVEYAIDAALGADLVDAVVVSSDDQDILDISKGYASVIALRRPAEISGNEALAITYVQHALDTIDEHFDMIVIVQPSSPFTLSIDIDNTISLLDGAKDCHSAVSVMALDHAIHPAKLKTLGDDRILSDLYENERGRMATHELPTVYVRNGSVYAASVDLISEGKIIGDRCRGYIMPRERSIDINDPIDLEFAEFMLTRFGKN